MGTSWDHQKPIAPKRWTCHFFHKWKEFTIDGRGGMPNILGVSDCQNCDTAFTPFPSHFAAIYIGHFSIFRYSHLPPACDRIYQSQVFPLEFLVTKLKTTKAWPFFNWLTFGFLHFPDEWAGIHSEITEQLHLILGQGKMNVSCSHTI